MEMSVKAEPPGYLETVIGALLGALVLGVVLSAIGVVVGALTGGGYGPDYSMGFAAGLFFGIGLGLLGLWIGPIAGAFLVLRLRGFRDPSRTARPMLILQPAIGLPIFFGVTAIFQSPEGALLSLPLAVSVPALAARAFARRRETGHL
jgi:MFS family permease